MKNLSAITALIILLIVGLACSESGDTTTTTSNSNTTTTETESANGAIVKSVTLMNAADETVNGFQKSDMTHKASVEFSESGVGNVRGVWTAVNAGGQKNVKILENEIELTSLLNTAKFTMQLQNPFPAGDFKLDVYLNGKLVKTHNYKVQ